MNLNNTPSGSPIPAAPNSVSNPNFDQYVTTGGVGAMTPNNAGLVQALMNTTNPVTNAGSGVKPVALLPSRIGPMAISEDGRVPIPIGNLNAGGASAGNGAPYTVTQPWPGYFVNNPVTRVGIHMPYPQAQTQPPVIPYPGTSPFGNNPSANILNSTLPLTPSTGQTGNDGTQAANILNSTLPLTPSQGNFPTTGQ